MPRYKPSDVEFRGYRMGADHPLVVTDLDMGTLEYRTQDAENPVGDNRFFGRDYLTPPTWTLTVESLEADDESMMRAVRDLHQVWVIDRRLQVGTYESLFFEIGGTPYQAVGRPRSISVDANGKNFGRVTITAEFALTVPYIFQAERQQVELFTYPSPQQGLIFDAVAPFIFGRGGTPRQGEINNTGNVPTPFRVTFYGPCSTPKVWSDTGGWVIEYSGSIKYDEQVTVDTLTGTVASSLQGNVAGGLTRKSSVQARIHPGRQEVMFTAYNPDQTARAVVSWLPGSYGI